MIETNLSALHTCNWTLALSRMGDDEEILGIISQLFLDEQQGYLDNINEAFQQKQWDVLYRELHTLKGVSGTLGAEKAEFLLRKAEEVLTDKGYAQVAELIQLIQKEIVLLVEILQSKVLE